MVLDAFVKAQDFLKVNGKTLIESLEDAEAFCQLDDSALYQLSCLKSSEEWTCVFEWLLLIFLPEHVNVSQPLYMY